MIRRLVAPTPLVAKINVTPIIDVALVLVIILLITAPMLAVADFDVDLPSARTRNLEEPTRVNVTLGLDGALAVGGMTISPAGLASTLRAELAEHEGEEVIVVVRADSRIRHEVVRELLKKLGAAGAPRLAIATRPEAGR